MTMPNISHSPEPWQDEPPDGYMLCVHDANGIPILEGAPGKGDYFEINSLKQANLRRARACVNACTGMADPLAEMASLRKLLACATAHIDARVRDWDVTEDSRRTWHEYRQALAQYGALKDQSPVTSHQSPPA